MNNKHLLSKLLMSLMQKDKDQANSFLNQYLGERSKAIVNEQFEQGYDYYTNDHEEIDPEVENEMSSRERMSRHEKRNEQRNNWKVMDYIERLPREKLIQILAKQNPNPELVEKLAKMDNNTLGSYVFAGYLEKKITTDDLKR